MLSAVFPIETGREAAHMLWVDDQVQRRLDDWVCVLVFAASSLGQVMGLVLRALSPHLKNKGFTSTYLLRVSTRFKEICIYKDLSIVLVCSRLLINVSTMIQIHKQQGKLIK